MDILYTKGDIMDKLTQQKIAHLMKITQPMVSRLITGGRRIGIKTAKKIATVTGQPWQQYVHMPGQELKQVLSNALNTKE